MKKKINFLKKRVEKIRKKAKRLFFVRMISLVVLVFYGLIVLGVTSFFLLVVKKRYQNLQNNIAQKKKDIQSLEEIETKYTYLDDKSGNLEEVFEQRNNYYETLALFFEIFPENFFLTDLSIDEQNRVYFSGWTSKFTDLKNFLTDLENQKQAEMIQATSKEINYGSKEGYSFTLEVAFAVEDEK